MRGKKPWAINTKGRKIRKRVERGKKPVSILRSGSTANRCKGNPGHVNRVPHPPAAPDILDLCRICLFQPPQGKPGRMNPPESLGESSLFYAQTSISATSLPPINLNKSPSVHLFIISHCNFFPVSHSFSPRLL